MRILSARARDIRHDRTTGHIAATVVLQLDRGGTEAEVRIRTSAPIHAPGAAPLKDRLIASAKLILALRDPTLPLAEAEVIRPAA